VAGPRTFFAWCGACNTVIDVTADAGAHRWQAFMPGEALSVFPLGARRAVLEAIVKGPTSDPRGRGRRCDCTRRAPGGAGGSAAR
jgi:hypothetical protein